MAADENNTDSENIPSNNIPSNNTNKKSNSALIFCLLVLIVVGAAAGFYFWQLLQQQAKIVSELQQQLNTNTQKNTHLQQSLAQQIQSASEQSAQLIQKNQQQLQKKLKQQQKKIQQIVSSDRSDWLLAEAEYLLRLANQYATLNKDSRSAETLLASADEILLELDESSVINIRRKIAEERAALKLRGNFDRDGLYLSIAALADQIDQLIIVDLTANRDDDAESSNEQAKAINDNKTSPALSTKDKILARVRMLLAQSSEHLKITQHDKPIGPLLSPTEQSYLKQNLRFMFEQAQLAVLQQRQTVYKRSIEKAQHWITLYFIIDPKLKENLLTELTILSQHDVAKPLPDISSSLNLLKNVIKTRRIVTTKPSNKPTKGDNQ